MKSKINYISTLMIVLILGLTLSACGTKEKEKEEVEIEENVEKKQPDESMLAGQKEESEITEDTFPDSGYVFELNKEEMELYDKYKENHDMNVFKDIDPISIAKIHIMYGIRGEWEAEYDMYDEEDKQTYEKSRHEEVYLKDLKENVPESKQSMANWIFPLLDEGEFIEEGETAFIKFYSVPTEEDGDKEDYVVNFHMRKDEDGVWRPRANPIYFGAED